MLIKPPLTKKMMMGRQRVGMGACVQASTVTDFYFLSQAVLADIPYDVSATYPSRLLGYTGSLGTISILWGG
jgi:hypothetical protein